MLFIIKDFLSRIIHKIRLRKLSFLKSNFNVGNGFRCGTGCFVSKKNNIQIGNNFYMGNYCHLSSNLEIGDNVMFASFVSCVGGDHRIDNITTTINKSGRDHFKTTRIESNVWIGHGSILMHGVHIEEGAVVASGSVVTKNVPMNAIVGGNPAKFIRFRKF